MMHPCTAAAAALFVTLAAPAQNVSLDKTGGAIGQTLTMQIEGMPNETYILLFDLVEAPTFVPALNVTLDIPATYAFLSYALPGWYNNTDAQGSATSSVVLPNDPGLIGVVASLQVIAGDGPFRVSNLVRVTPQAPGTFAGALSAPAVPILGGGVVDEGAGDFLFVGGSGPVAQRYSERLEEWELAGAALGVGLFSQTTALGDGRVLFTGGLDLATGQPSATAAIYDPVGQQTTTLQMATARAGHGASRMGNGKVLITGGNTSFNLQSPLSLFTGLLASTEIFDAATDTFSNGPNMLEPRAFHSSSTLTNGQVLIAGGLTSLPIINLPTVSSTAYKFNPANNSFGLPAFFSGARLLHTATALDNGKVLIAGGVTLDLSVFLTTLNILDIIIGTRDDCQLYSVGTFGFGTFQTVNGMQQGRAGAAIAPLPGGSALIAGGFELTIDIPTAQFVFHPTASADVFSPSPNALLPTGSLAAPRAFPVTVNLPDGTIMVIGGGLPTAEIYQR